MGNVTQMRDYTKMMKYYEKRSQIKIKEDLEKEVSALKAEYEALKLKAASQKKINVVNRDKLRSDHLIGFNQMAQISF